MSQPKNSNISTTYEKSEQFIDTNNALENEEQIEMKDVEEENKSPNVQIKKYSQLPLVLGVIKILNLGTVEYKRPNFHNERYIFPIGYTAERMYQSYKDPSKKIPYKCEILDGGDGPLFRVTPSDDPENPSEANTPTGAWLPIIKKKKRNLTVSGPEFFGLSNIRVRKMIEMLPNAEKCENLKSISNKQEEDTYTELNGRTRKRKLTPLDIIENELELEPPTKVEKRESTQDSESDSTPITYPGISPDKPLPNLKVYQYRCLSREIPAYDGNEKYPEFYEQGLQEDYTPYMRTQTNYIPQSFPLHQQHPNRMMTVLTPNMMTQKFTQPQQVNPMMRPQMNISQPIPKIPPQGMKDLPPHMQQPPLQMTIPIPQTNVQKPLQTFAFIQQSNVQSQPSKQMGIQPQQLIKPVMQQVKIEQKVEPKIEPVQQKEPTPLELLRNMWEFVYVYHCCRLLRPVLKISEFTPEELEQAILNPEKHSQLLADIHVRIIKGPAIDKKSQGYLEPGNKTWTNVVKNKLEQLEDQFKEWELSPLRTGKKYKDLHPVWKVIIMKALCDWKISTNARVQEHLKQIENSLRETPIGYDRHGHSYWYFGDDVGRLYKEILPTRPNSFDDEKTRISKRGKWQMVCDACIKQYRKFLETIENSTNEAEQKLHDVIKFNILPDLEVYLKQKETEKKRVEAERLYFEELRQAELERQRKEQEERERKRREREAKKLQKLMEKRRLEEEKRRAQMQQMGQSMMQIPGMQGLNPMINLGQKVNQSDDEYEKITTRSGRKVSRKRYDSDFVALEGEDIDLSDLSDSENEKEKEKNQPVVGNMRLRNRRSVKYNEDDEFIPDDDKEEEDEEIEDDGDEYINEEEEELPEEEFHSDEEYDDDYPKKKRGVGKKTKFEFTSTPFTNKMALPPMANRQQLPQPPQGFKPMPLFSAFGGNQMQLPQTKQAPIPNPNPAILNSPGFQQYYQQYLKMVANKQQQSTMGHQMPQRGNFPMQQPGMNPMGHQMGMNAPMGQHPMHQMSTQMGMRQQMPPMHTQMQPQMAHLQQMQQNFNMRQSGMNPMAMRMGMNPMGQQMGQPMGQPMQQMGPQMGQQMGQQMRPQMGQQMRPQMGQPMGQPMGRQMGPQMGQQQQQPMHRPPMQTSSLDQLGFSDLESNNLSHGLLNPTISGDINNLISGNRNSRDSQNFDNLLSQNSQNSQDFFFNQ